MSSDKYSVFLYTISGYKELSKSGEVTCESICHELCKELSIASISSILFSLRVFGTNNYLPSCRCLLPKTKYEFRVRFQTSSLSELKQLDGNAFDYLYRQVRYDMENSLIPDLKYPNYKEKVVGLGVTNRYIDMLEDDTRTITMKTLKKDLRKYVPKNFYEKHHYTLKQKFEERLTNIAQTNRAPMLVYKMRPNNNSFLNLTFFLFLLLLVT